MRVSVIIPFTQSSRNLADCVASVYAQTYADVEPVMLGKSRAEARDTRSEQRNRLITAARGDFILSLDSDCLLMSDVVEKCLSLVESGADMVCITNRSPAGDGTYSRMKQIENEVLGESGSHVAVNFYRRTDAIRAGLFDESMDAFEDFDFHKRMVTLGLKWELLRDSWLIHLGDPASFTEEARRAFAYGRRVSSESLKGMDIQNQPLRITYLKAVPKFRLYFFPFLLYKAVQYMGAAIALLTR